MTEAIVGFLTGVLASMGLGGGFILVVWLTLFAGTEQRAAQGINVLFFLPIALIALVMHLKSGLVNKALVKKCIFGGVIGAGLGTLGSQIIANDMLRKLY
ncbi:MAG: sulfite exporter TauE/SafE family protein, partial [Oscillospiraceae bacterium]|nr:sulfite exporter TauE/SafE family protein [Oscillospiraceae bacterium]